jgi:hypothetical protein
LNKSPYPNKRRICRTDCHDIAMDAEDNLALIWQGPSAKLADIFYTLHNEDTQAWNLDSQLTHDQAIKNEMAPAFAAADELMVARARQTMTYTDKVISSALTFARVNYLSQKI